jgi:transposase
MQHLANFKGTLQADAYAGFNRLYDSGDVKEAACWAHVRRKFFDIEQAHACPLAREAPKRIAELYAVIADNHNSAEKILDPDQRGRE